MEDLIDKLLIMYQSEFNIKKGSALSKAAQKTYNEAWNAVLAANNARVRWESDERVKRHIKKPMQYIMKLQMRYRK